MGEKVVFVCDGLESAVSLLEVISDEEWYCEISRCPLVRKWSRVTPTRMFPGKGFYVYLVHLECFQMSNIIKKLGQNIIFFHKISVSYSCRFILTFQTIQNDVFS